MGKIVPHLWFDQEVEEAVELYTSLFENSQIVNKRELKDTPSGDALTVEFTLGTQEFMAINAGPYFTFNPAISFMVICDTKEEVRELWDQLIKDGSELMPLDAYDFSEYYGWVEDKYGLSWQLIYGEDMDYEQKITPALLFSNEMVGKAEEAMSFYPELFQNGKILDVYEYKKGEAENPQAKIGHGNFKLMEMNLIAADNAYDVDYSFNEAISLMVYCVTQSEIDYYWEKLSADPEAEECGWLKDKYGVSWQIIPERMNELLNTGSRAQIDAVTQKFLKMKKLNISELETAWHTA
jgi:predicted 3-demethylubiquinone-9 3-methyltransferase (glyoxalase superfamily)